jgi:hypothetical protein
MLKEVEPATPGNRRGHVAQAEKRRAHIQTEDELRQLLGRLRPPVCGFAVQFGCEPMTSALIGLSFPSPTRRSTCVRARLSGARNRSIERRFFCYGLARARRLPPSGRGKKRDSHLLANHGIALAGCVHDIQLESCVLEVLTP